ncbi:PA14 domain-containing protein [Tieghemostelium lacteum]|uniref:PA14 domain-containing protein n=1 Tax=Tieghemostelium lacteum TaxID=361077 RepID=A0A151ZIU5_TIELA|nr:PA14 domain-containing protein [Tieghemostelium lacteum]|eukprot:KYQ93819.1 PA14 domain-containing protein [Tieghemostelium lacteum]
MKSATILFLTLAVIVATVYSQTTETLTITVLDHWPGNYINKFYPGVSGIQSDFQPDPTLNPWTAISGDAQVVKNMTVTYLPPSRLISYVGKGNQINKQSKDSVWNATTFSGWFEPIDTVNVPVAVSLPFIKTLVSNEVYRYTYSSSNFFPLDGKGFCNKTLYPLAQYPQYNCDLYKDNSGKAHNFHFCMHWSSYFTYKRSVDNPQTFAFEGDDDVWVYFDKTLKIDLGSIHGPKSATFYAGTEKNNVNIHGFVDGQQYDFDFFYCERKTTGSNIKIETNMGLNCAWRDYCNVCEGTGSTCCVAERDCNDNKKCTTDTCPSPLTPGINETNWKSFCSNTPVTCDNSNKCQNNTCSESTGQCTASNLCTTTDLCKTASCKSTSVGCQFLDKQVCTKPSDRCFTRNCNSTTGTCDELKTTLNTNCKTTNKCETKTCDATLGCVTTTKTCEEKLCQTVSCNADTGNCVYTPVPNCNSDCGPTGTCTTGDKCKIPYCTGGGCYFNNTSPPQNENKCLKNPVCDSATGQFSYTPTDCTTGVSACYPSPYCNSTDGLCYKGPKLSCNDQNQCTDDSCDDVTGECKNIDRICEDGDACTINSCDPLKGCFYTQKTCPTTSLCETGYCSAGECKTKPKDCPSPNFCEVAKCDERIGCLTVPRECVSDDNDCYSSSCDYSAQECVNKAFDPLPFKCQSAAVKTGVAIGAAATAGIVIGGAVALGLAIFGSKKTYDYWKTTRDTKMSAAVDNPLFQASNNSVENPLFDAEAR